VRRTAPRPTLGRSHGKARRVDDRPMPDCGLGWLAIDAATARPAQAYRWMPTASPRSGSWNRRFKCRSCRKDRYSPPVNRVELTVMQEISPYKWLHPGEENQKVPVFSGLQCGYRPAVVQTQKRRVTGRRKQYRRCHSKMNLDGGRSAGRRQLGYPVFLPAMSKAPIVRLAVCAGARSRGGRSRGQPGRPLELSDYCSGISLWSVARQSFGF
jgi:hypothetical protein